MANLRGIAGSGVDRETGKGLVGWAHVEQCLGVIFTTQFGERVMREWFGSLVPVMLGRNMTPQEILPFWTAIWTAIDTWEPRFKVTQVTPLDLNRLGHLSLQIEGVFRPRGHLGDFEPAGKRRVKFIVREGERRLEAVSG
jgi:phage baseplate assembly protein W